MAVEVEAQTMVVAMAVAALARAVVLGRVRVNVLEIVTVVQVVATSRLVHTCKPFMAKRRIVFIVTQDCQLQCNYCYLIGKNKEGRMTWETAKRIADFLMSLPVIENEVIFDFIGGEPLLEIDLISKVSDYLVETMEKTNHPWLKNYSFRFTTNGLTYSTNKVQEFIEKYKDHLSVQISIDGTKKKHDINRVFANGEGSYDRLIPNVKLWINQFGKDARSFMVISHEDLPYLSESIIHLIELGIQDLAVSLVVEDVWKAGDDAILENEFMVVANYIIEKRLWDKVIVSMLRKEVGEKEKDEHIFPCGQPMYVFDAHGKIYTCVRFVDYSLRSKPARIIGTIQDGIDYNKIRPLLAYNRISSYPLECLDCEIGACCRWCPAESYDSSETGTIFQRTTTVCQLHKATVRVKNYLWNRINYLIENERP